MKIAFLISITFKNIFFMKGSISLSLKKLPKHIYRNTSSKYQMAIKTNSLSGKLYTLKFQLNSKKCVHR